MSRLDGESHEDRADRLQRQCYEAAEAALDAANAGDALYAAARALLEGDASKIHLAMVEWVVVRNIVLNWMEDV
jgi:hypothetical protein